MNKNAQEELPAFGALYRREAHHIHGSFNSGKLSSGRVSSPGGQGVPISFQPLRCVQGRVKNRDGEIGPAADGTKPWRIQRTRQ
jgi:hypothetical protein